MSAAPSSQNPASYSYSHRLQGPSSALIYVGADNHCWVLPVDLLCHVSTFFKAALKGGFEEAKEKRVTLKEEDPSAFELFVLWLYKGQILNSKKPEALDVVIVKAWVMGDKLGAPDFQDCTMRALVIAGGSQDLLTDTEAIGYIYNNTAVGSPLRMVTVDTIVFVWENIDQRPEAWKSLVSGGGDLIVDLLMAFKEHWEPLDNGPANNPRKYLLKN